MVLGYLGIIEGKLDDIVPLWDIYVPESLVKRTEQGLSSAGFLQASVPSTHANEIRPLRNALQAIYNAIPLFVGITTLNVREDVGGIESILLAYIEDECAPKERVIGATPCETTVVALLENGVVSAHYCLGLRGSQLHSVHSWYPEGREGLGCHPYPAEASDVIADIGFPIFVPGIERNPFGTLSRLVMMAADTHREWMSPFKSLR